MSPINRLDVLANEIRRLRIAIIEHERDTFLLEGDDEAAARRDGHATTTRALLHAALIEHFELSERLRAAETRRDVLDHAS